MERARIVGALFLLAMLVAFMPLGCSNKLGPVRATQNGGIDQPNYPDKTIERFRECMAEFGSQLQPGYHALDAKVEVGEDGLKYGVEVEKLPESGEEFGSCMRVALQDMAISEKLLDEAKEKLKYQRQQGSAEQKQLMGSPVIVVVGVTIVVSEVVLEAGAITILFATTVTLIDKAATDVAELAKRRRRWENECNEKRTLCLLSNIADLPGGLYKHTLCSLCLDACIKSKGNWPSQLDRFDGTPAPCDYWRYSSN